MSRPRVVSIVVCLLLVFGSPAHAPTRPERDPILEALGDELARSASGLKLAELETPYFIEYSVADLRTLDLTASLGALVESRVDRSRPLRVDVRVGSYDLDSSEFLGRHSSSPWASWGLVQDDDVVALRHDLWLATDSAYKKSLEQMAQKRAALRNKLQTDSIPDFARAEPRTEVRPRPAHGLDEERWAGIVKRLSAVFREFPAIQESRVELHAVVGSRYLVNTEGSAIRQPITVAGLVASAQTRAEDGMQLAHFAPFYARDLSALPAEPSLAAATRKMAEELTALAAAPVLDRYVGPVLFTGSAAAEVFAQLLAPELSGQRPPLTEDERTAARLPQGKLAERLGRRVLPVFLSAVDDPTRTEFSGRALLGSYEFDEQGVPGQAVSLVEKGMLRSFVLSRRPRKEIAASNGHGRASAYGAPSAEIANLILEARPGRTSSDLRRQLLEICAAQGMEYGLRIELLDLPFLSGREDLRGRGQDTLTPPVLAYRVFVADGREELVRGLATSDADVRALREIVAAGDEPTVWSRPYLGRGATISATGPIGTESLAITVAAPAVLFEELELKRAPGPLTRPALLANPAFLD